ncbi:unnamed protein product [Cyclocybe aegerita]|uniref:F-box domain-containing protein n=1 Tax=Cyclocybe aegerita TaxID=1973307 RepID=A0A8S0XPF0_CYCAE|nr:unnamed protein product [Cyclocybe aegerita]
MTPSTVAFSSGLVNRQGFAALPDELYLEIISKLPTPPIPKFAESPEETRGLRERYKTLLSLSQTCRSLRHVFLRYLCQRVEVYNEMQTSDGVLPSLYYYRPVSSPNNGHILRVRPYAEEILEQLERVTIRDESLAVHVNVLNLTIPDYSLRTLLPELARCIGLFHNLHTVQLNLYLAEKHDKYVERYFKEYTYPNIRTVSVDGSDLHRMGLAENDDLDVGLVEKCPRLRDITVDYMSLRISAKLDNSLKRLSLLPKLQTLRLAMHVQFEFLHLGRIWRQFGISSSSPNWSEIDRCEKWAMEVLHDVKSPEKVNKRVYVISKLKTRCRLV